MSVRLHNTKIEYTVGTDVYVGDNDGVDSYYHLVELANEYCQDEQAIDNDWWMNADNEETLELSLPLAKAIMDDLDDGDKQTWQSVIDEAIQWNNDCVRLELW